ncbi:MAG: hypothetical protein QOD96_5904 [Pseudonocardiales bacterium]|nr:hypothetical protein [Pseudonocardiales bacterium]
MSVLSVLVSVLVSEAQATTPSGRTNTPVGSG